MIARNAAHHTTSCSGGSPERTLRHRPVLRMIQAHPRRPALMPSRPLCCVHRGASLCCVGRELLPGHAITPWCSPRNLLCSIAGQCASSMRRMTSGSGWGGRGCGRGFGVWCKSAHKLHLLFHRLLCRCPPSSSLPFQHGCRSEQMQACRLHTPLVICKRIYPDCTVNPLKQRNIFFHCLLCCCPPSGSLLDQQNVAQNGRRHAGRIFHFSLGQKQNGRLSPLLGHLLSCVIPCLMPCVIMIKLSRYSSSAFANYTTPYRQTDEQGRHSWELSARF